MKEDEKFNLSELFTSIKEGKKGRNRVSKENFKRPAYSYTSICPDEKFRIVKAATAKLSTK